MGRFLCYGGIKKQTQGCRDQKPHEGEIKIQDAKKSRFQNNENLILVQRLAVLATLFDQFFIFLVAEIALKEIYWIDLQTFV